MKEGFLELANELIAEKPEEDDGRLEQIGLVLILGTALNHMNAKKHTPTCAVCEMLTEMHRLALTEVEQKWPQTLERAYRMRDRAKAEHDLQAT